MSDQREQAKEIMIRVGPDFRGVKITAEPVVIEGMTFWLHNSTTEGGDIDPNLWTLSEERTGMAIATAPSAKLLLAAARATINAAGGPLAVAARIETQLASLRANGVEI